MPEVDDVTVPTDPDPQPSRGGRFFAVLKRLARLVMVFVGLLTLGLVAAAVALLFPYVRDDLQIDGIVQAVALDWRDFGQAKAEERLRFEFASRSIGAHANASHCALVQTGPVRHVGCDWTVTFRVAQQSIPLSFASSASITADGDLITP